MVMRGFILSLDAIVASGLLLLLALFIAGFSLSFSAEDLDAKRVFYVSKDITTVLFDATLRDVKEFTTVKNALATGAIVQDDLNKTLIEALGFWWATGNQSLAENLTGEILNQTLNNSLFGAEVLLDETVIYRRDLPQQRLLAKTQAVVSGLELGKKPEGYVASAVATQLKKNTTLIFPFDPEGSGIEQGTRVLVTKKFYLNSSEVLTINNATLYVSIHYGNQDLSAQKFYVNAQIIQSSDVTWFYEHIPKTINGHATHLSVGKVDVKDSLQFGWNTIRVDLKGDTEWYSHIHPGFRLEMDVEENATNVDVSPNESITYYFDKIDSEASGSKDTGVWSTLSFFLPKGAQVINATLYVKGIGINNISADDIPVGAPKANVQIYLNNLTVALADPVSQDDDDELNITLNFSLKENVTSGTNIISVYLNSYANDYWGKLDTILYSDPQNDPTNSSRLVVEYVKPPTEIKFGNIQVGVKEKLGGETLNPKEYNKTFNGSVLFRTFLHLMTLDNENVTVNTSYPGFLQQVFRTPRQFATPTTVFVDPQYLSATQKNTIRIGDDCTDLCNITNESSYEYFLWIPSFVGYNDTFPNSSAATEDAQKRLEIVLGPYLEAVEVVNSTVFIPDIPSLWGPAKMEVRIWL
ncbi:MAG: hypothetical protein HY369_04820 [Candidatus Aenigmarchaeota archaeon]|nr:hypothetical protein [Candidatus Aenigmarchaeota archaeon]